MAKSEGAEAFRRQGQRITEQQGLYELRQRVRQLEEERAILKRPRRNNAQRGAVKYAFIRDHLSEFRVSAMCRALEVSPAGYYRWRDRVPGKRATQNQRLVEKIKAAHGASRATYGSPKIYRQLREQGERSTVSELRGL